MKKEDAEKICESVAKESVDYIIKNEIPDYSIQKVMLLITGIMLLSEKELNMFKHLLNQIDKLDTIFGADKP